jgi:hypothetical protein
MSFYLVQSDNGIFQLSSTWPKTNTKAFRKGILCFNAPATLFKTRLEAQKALARTRKYADRYYPHWRTWLDTSFIVRARLA